MVVVVVAAAAAYAASCAVQRLCESGKSELECGSTAVVLEPR
jgi:hypothetical protein